MRNLYKNLGLYVLFRLQRTHTHTQLHTPVVQITQAIRFSSKYKEKISTYRNHIAQDGRAELRENSKPSTRFSDLKPETNYDATMGYRLRGGHHDRPSRPCSFILLHNIPYVCIIRSSFKKLPKFARTIYKNCYYRIKK